MKIQSVLTPTALLLMLMLGFFTSCKKDECNPDPWGIVGNWDYMEDYQMLENGVVVVSQPTLSGFYSFRADGTGQTTRSGLTKDIAWYYTAETDELIFYVPGESYNIHNCKKQSQDEQSITLVDSSFFILQLPPAPAPVRYSRIRTFTLTKI